MEFEINGKYYNVEIIKKRNKNTYIRVRKDLTIVVTTSLFTFKKDVINLLNKNQAALQKMIDRQRQLHKKDALFYYLGSIYDIMYIDYLKEIKIENNIIYTKNETMLNKWYKKEVGRIFDERLKHCYNLFEEKIPYPILKIRTMKTRWGVCNKRDNSVTLNTNLIKYGINEIDYVIIHELSHFVHFNHSSSFWNTVSKYCCNYKLIKKKLKE